MVKRVIISPHARQRSIERLADRGESLYQQVAEAIEQHRLSRYLPDWASRFPRWRRCDLRVIRLENGDRPAVALVAFRDDGKTALVVTVITKSSERVVTRRTKGRGRQNGRRREKARRRMEMEDIDDATW